MKGFYEKDFCANCGVELGAAYSADKGFHYCGEICKAFHQTGYFRPGEKPPATPTPAQQDNIVRTCKHCGRNLNGEQYLCSGEDIFCNHVCRKLFRGTQQEFKLGNE